MIDLVELPRTCDRYPHELSGGNSNGLVVRALAADQDIILMDEPLVPRPDHHHYISYRTL